MMNEASTSNPSFIVEVGEYPCPSHVIAPNFVTVTLSGRNNYNIWKTQILCLLKSHQMYGFIDGQIPRPAGNWEGSDQDIQAWIASDSLVKSWILGSLSEEANREAVNHLIDKQKNTDFTAKDLWDELQLRYGPSETKLPRRQAELVIRWNSKSEDAKSKDLHKRWVYKDVLVGNTDFIMDSLRKYDVTPWDKITNNGNTVLHVAVGSSIKNQKLLEKLLVMTPKEITLLDLINSDGSTLLHVAAIGGNTEAVNILVKRNPELLSVEDCAGQTPLALSVSNMHTETSECLFKHMKEQEYDALFKGKSGEDLVILAISCQDFRLANMIIEGCPDAVLSYSGAVLTELASKFPRELKFWERRGDEFVSLKFQLFKSHVRQFLINVSGWREEFSSILASNSPTDERINKYLKWPCGSLLLEIFPIFITGLCMLKTVFNQFLKVLVQPFVQNTFQIHEDATYLLESVCQRIKDSNTYHHKYYIDSIFESTRQNSSTFIRRIKEVFPNAIWCTNGDGHNCIQYSVINRSEKIYNLLYEMREDKNMFKTIRDSSGNNLLHLAARIAPTNKLKHISGAALQIQRELQWFKEVEQFVWPLNRIQKNLAGDTPAVVFTKEHKVLVSEGENWIKKTAESYTITAALIITIVFAAAITVPGGNNQESGILIFINNIAFTVFAISNAISLFTAVTSLLLFLSILTTRFAEQDFLFKLPTKLIIGLTMLFLSTTAMIIAFGATLFLVFGQNNLLMLIPIGALTCLPITSFVTLQFPLIVELISSTYCGGIFAREEYDDIFY